MERRRQPLLQSVRDLQRAPRAPSLLLRRLYQPAYYDRQAQHAPDAPKVLWAPLFRWDGRELYSRLTPGLIRSGYEMLDERVATALGDALECLEAYDG